MTDKSSASNTTTSPEGASRPRDQAAMQLKSSVVEGAHDLTNDVKHITTELSGEARKAAESQISAGKARAAEELGSVASALRKTGQHLRAAEKTSLTEYIDRAAQQVDVAAGYLQRRSLGQVMGDVESFARREPALFLGGAFVAGLVGGRFLKSARPQPAQANFYGTTQGASRLGERGSQARQGQPEQQAERRQEPLPIATQRAASPQAVPQQAVSPRTPPQQTSPQNSPPRNPQQQTASQNPSGSASTTNKPNGPGDESAKTRTPGAS